MKYSELAKQIEALADTYYDLHSTLMSELEGDLHKKFNGLKVLYEGEAGTITDTEICEGFIYFSIDTEDDEYDNIELDEVHFLGDSNA